MKRFNKNVAIVLLIAVYVNLLNPVYATTALNGRYWDKTSLKYYISSTVSSSYGSSVYYQILYGAQSWSGLSAMVLSSGTTSDNDIEIYMSNYGATGWNGLHNPDSYDSSTNVMEHSTITLNTYYYLQSYSSYTSDINFWRAIACHEVGHSLGLSHNSTSGETSIMKSSTGDFYTLSGSSPKLTSPQTADITALQSLYGS